MPSEIIIFDKCSQSGKRILYRSLNLIYMRFTFYPLILLIAVYIAGCSKNSTPKPTPPQTKPTADTALAAVWPTDADAYFVGTTSETNLSNIQVATIWKNGVATPLPNSESTLDSEADAIAVSGSDIYVIGKIHVGTSYTSGYWKNGVFSALASGGSNALAIVVNGSDVYIAGNVGNNAAYWKNGTLNLIARQDSNTFYQANSIAVNGNDVYLAGFSGNAITGGTKAIVWKNGVVAALPDNNSTNAVVNAVTVDGTDIYAVGYTSGGATLWKNGVITLLPVPSSVTSNSADAIVINGSDVYIAGYAGGRATTWKNGTATILPFDEHGSSGFVSLAMDHNDLYVASGFDNLANPIYWKNGVAYQFGKAVDVVHGIAIAPH